MTADARKPARFTLLPPLTGIAISLVLIGVALVASPIDFDPAGAGWRPKAPAFGLIAQQGLTLQLHLFAALTALAVGIVIMLRPKGVRLHKALGWTWVLAMAVTAISSLFLSSFTGDRFSLIHLLSGWTIIALPMGVAAIRRRNVAGHRRAMTSMFTGGLLVAGALTLIPGRLMWRVFFG